ncbi:hypothetical protein [Anaplasma marginale]|uniref:hypothetical protein n=1 Tax=Anaplasma marginale TaxID=770 RepID=UPI000681E15D|nr:hypothetical protein [Anaplasma marginale]
MEKELSNGALGFLSLRAEQEKLSLKLKYLSALYPNADIEVWAEDEQRIGLQPILRLVWTPIDEQPIANVKIQYKWVWRPR